MRRVAPGRVTPRRAGERGFSLMEMLIAVGVLAAISVLIYGAFAGMRGSKEAVGRLGDRFHEGREALRRISRELSSAYLSMHRPLDPNLLVQTTAFIGSRGTAADRVDFSAFAHRRLDRNAHESDQCELSYYGSEDPKNRGVTDLVRRISPRLDLEPDRGGRVDVLATDIDLFELKYLDPQTGLWTDGWDSTDVTHENQLPAYVHVVLVLNGGKRAAAARGRGTLRFETKVSIPIQRPLSFAIE